MSRVLKTFLNQEKNGPAAAPCGAGGAEAAQAGEVRAHYEHESACFTEKAVGEEQESLEAELSGEPAGMEEEAVLAEAHRLAAEFLERMEVYTEEAQTRAEAANPEAFARFWGLALQASQFILDPATPEKLEEFRRLLADMEAAWPGAGVRSSAGGGPAQPNSTLPEEAARSACNFESSESGRVAQGDMRLIREAGKKLGSDSISGAGLLQGENSDGFSSGMPARRNQLSLFIPDPTPKAGSFRSPWQDWLDAVEVIPADSLDEWLTALAEARLMEVTAIDTETTGLDPLQNRLRLVQLVVPVYPPVDGERRLVSKDGRAPEPGGGARACVLDLFALPEEERREALEALADLVADPGVLKVGHNLKFDLAFLRRALGGRRLDCKRLFDTMIASQLCAAGDFVPGGQWEKWCAEQGLRPAKNEHGQELKTKLLDAHEHLVEFEHDNQKEIKPFYPTHSLQQVAHRHLEVLLDKTYQAANWSGEVSLEMLRYAALDAAVLLPLHEILKDLLIRNRLVKIAKVEFDCLPATVEVELSGMPFDAPRARELLQDAKEKTAQYREALTFLASGAGFQPRSKKSGKKRAAGFNPDSGVDCVDLLRLLAEKEGILTGEKLAVGGEEFDLETRDETLSRLLACLSVVRLKKEESRVWKFADALRSYRGAKKRTDFLGKWLDLLHPADGRLHPSLRQINPQSVGRFSASNPNLQQAPRGSDVRALFRVPEGRKLVVADYSGIEMRIMAQLSGDANLITTFREGADVHRRTAAAVAGKPEEEVSKEERQMAKAVNFGLIYGMTAETLRLYAETGYGVKITLEEAEAAREAFFRAYPGIAAWHAVQERKMFENGFKPYWQHDFKCGFYREERPCVRTLGGRLRVWPVVERKQKDGNGMYWRKAGSRTELFNTPDQGTGADMLKCAMARLYQEFLQRGWEDVRMIATVHDELVLEASEEKAGEAAEVLKVVMEAAGAQFLPDVPVEVEVAVCESWAEKA